MDGLWHGRTNGSGRVEKRYAAVREVDEAPGNGEGGEMRVLVWRLGCVGCAMAGLMSFPSGLWYLAVGLTSCVILPQPPSRNPIVLSVTLSLALICVCVAWSIG
jgi:hypothetical protein